MPVASWTKWSGAHCRARWSNAISARARCARICAGRAFGARKRCERRIGRPSLWSSGSRQPWKNRARGTASSSAALDEPFTNSLSQRFVPAGTPGVLFCIWETRVRDFEAFVKDTGHWVQPGFDINEAGEWIKRDGADWRAPPGYAQTLEHPVV